MDTVIPFSGFYGSWHDEALDDALENMCGDSSGNPIFELVHRAFDHVNWKHAHTEYAKAYAEAFGDEFEIVGLTFKELVSPREYNFTTDRIFVSIPDSEIDRIFDQTPAALLDQVAEEEFTSRSGFHSFYSNDFRSWGPLDEWDHNQRYALILAYVLHINGSPLTQDKEFDLMEGCSGNGCFDDWVSSEAGPELNRVLNVAHYLRSREDRKYRVCL